MTVLNLQVGASGSDSQQQSIPSDAGRNVTGAGSCSLTGTKLEVGSHSAGDEWSAAARFTGATIPQGATINSATFQMRANASYNASPNVIKLYASAQDSDTAAALSSTDGDLNAAGRPRTTATAVLDVSSVTGGNWYSWDVTASVQELVDRATFGETVVLILVDTHEDTTTNEWQDMDGYDGAAAGAPKLDVDYTVGSSHVDVPEIDYTTHPKAFILRAH